MDDLFCSDRSCEFSRGDWQRISELANIGDPPDDPSNAYVKNPAAVALGHRFYFEKDFSGVATWIDQLGRRAPNSRAAAKGDPIRISCATCHNPARAGSDFTSFPGHVSEGAGWYDVNAQQTLNVAHYPLLYWNGRSDSTWAQAAAVMEGDISMNGTRLAIVWMVMDKYRADYEAVFGASPLPVAGKSSEVAARCMVAADACPSDACRVVPVMMMPTCQPRFPLKGKPGEAAFDGMDKEDKKLVTRAYTNIAKAIGAYEWQLYSRNSLFDRWVNEEPGAELPPAAVRGLKLFVGRASCIDCHNTPLFSDRGFHNIGVPQRGTGVPTEIECLRDENGMVNARCDCVNGKKCLPWGFWDGLSRLKPVKAEEDRDDFRRDGPFADNREAGRASYGGYYDLPYSDDLKGTWRTPSLRDVALTPPYMHDGYYKTLEDVVWHYDQGGAALDDQPPTPAPAAADAGAPAAPDGGAADAASAPAGRRGKAVELKPLHLSVQDRADLVEFLKTLTGTPGPANLIAPPPATP
jgi:cytochrome c peroxidase